MIKQQAAIWYNWVTLLFTAMIRTSGGGGGPGNWGGDDENKEEEEEKKEEEKEEEQDEKNDDHSSRLRLKWTDPFKISFLCVWGLKWTKAARGHPMVHVQ